MINNISSYISKYSAYANYDKTNTEKKTGEKLTDFSSTANGRFDGFARSGTSYAGAAYGTADTIGEGAEKNMQGVFGQAAGGYELQRGKTDDYGSYMIRSTKKSVIYIDPRFYASISEDPEKIKEYSDAIDSMKQIDKMMERRAKAQGQTIVSRGWYIDKDGNISSWSIVKNEKKVKKTQLEKMRDLQRKISEKRTAKKKENAKIEKKRSEKKEALLRLEGKKKAAMKEKFKRKAKGCTVIDLNDLEIMRRSKQKGNNKKTV